ncbi:MAG TPA: MFS transporter [Chloroflexia bacterium]|nr:MFS transporter [Chloroflexia bacterium]
MIHEQAPPERPFTPYQPEGEVPSSILDVMRNPNFLKLWLAQITSQTAQQIVNFALVLQVEQITGSSTAVSGIIMAFTIPAILFAAIAGVFVERNSKRLMLVLTNLARGIMVLAYFFTDASWGTGTVLLIFYLVTFAFASVSQFFNPAEASMIPLVVKRHELIAANSIFNLTLSATMLGGFVVLGPLLLNTIFHNNFGGLYLVIFALCLIAAALAYFLPKDAASGPVTAKLQSDNGTAKSTTEVARSGVKAAWAELVEGWSFIKRDSVIMSAIVYWSIAIAVFMMLGTIGPGFLRRVLGIDPSQLIYVLMPGGIGLVIGVILVGRISTPGNRQTMINWSLLAAGAMLLIFAIVEPVLRLGFNVANGIGIKNIGPGAGLMLGIMGFFTLMLGLFNSFISVPAQTALQERTREDMRARVFSAFYTVSNAVIILPVPIAAALADSWGYVPTVASIGVVVMLIAAFGLYRSRQRRGKTEPLLNGNVTAEGVEAALTVASPAPRPIPASAEQEKRGK